ncbi:MAG: hypothetical protein OXE86_12600 [Alphaproteobacteria bacterium]|nr:hypothetical protein [Alphaproteobacteria bacterium]
MSPAPFGIQAAPEPRSARHVVAAGGGDHDAQAAGARFPSGSAVTEIEARKARYEEGGGRLDEGAEQGMIETLARELADLAVRGMQGA